MKSADVKLAYDENGRALRDGVVHDPVVSNAIFRETLRKERNFHIREEFTLTSKAMNTIPPKPNLVVGGQMPEIVAKKHGLVPKVMDPNTTKELNSFLQNLQKTPTEKFAGPLTSQQEIGWYILSHSHKFRARKNFGVKSNDITNYAEAYSVTVGRSPFHRRPPIA